MYHRAPTIRFCGGEGRQEAYAYAPNGPAYWTRESFEANVSPENRGRFIVQRETPAPAEREAARIPDGDYTLSNGDVYTVQGGEVYHYGFCVMDAPATVEELPERLWERTCGMQRGLTVVSCPAPAATAVEPEPAPAQEAAPARMADGEYALPDGTAITVRNGGVEDEYGNWCFYAPAGAEDLPGAWEDYLANCE